MKGNNRKLHTSAKFRKCGKAGYYQSNFTSDEQDEEVVEEVRHFYADDPSHVID